MHQYMGQACQQSYLSRTEGIFGRIERVRSIPKSEWYFTGLECRQRQRVVSGADCLWKALYADTSERSDAPACLL
ncbi:unnamed protein product [Jaminaea pallidilutea]